MNQLEISPMRDKVAAELRRAILYGTFAAFEYLSLDRLANDLGVSKMPVREALQILSMEGLVTIRPNHSAIVNKITDDYIRDHFDVRSLLEQEAIYRAAVFSGDCTELRDCCLRADEACKMEDYTQFNIYNSRIHQIIWRFSANQKLEQLLSQMWNTMHIDNYAQKNALASNKEHKEMVACIVDREPQIARQVMKSHVDRSYKMILEIKNHAKDLL